MGFESPNLIVDPAKAEEMAYAAKDLRAHAAVLRAPGPISDKEYIASRARQNDKEAEKFENEAGEEYDERKRLEGMNDNDLYHLRTEAISLQSSSEKAAKTMNLINKILIERAGAEKKDQ